MLTRRIGYGEQPIFALVKNIFPPEQVVRCIVHVPKYAKAHILTVSILFFIEKHFRVSHAFLPYLRIVVENKRLVIVRVSQCLLPQDSTYMLTEANE